VAHLAHDTRRSNEVWKLRENSLDRRTATDDFHARADNDVTPSRWRLFLQPTNRTKWKESGPDEGLCDVGHHKAPRELPA
jgi:hypothetical protein